MRYQNNIFKISKEQTLGLIILSLLLIIVFGLRAANGARHQTIKGTLDQESASYLIQQDFFISDFIHILEADFPTQTSNQETPDDKWLESFKLMQDRILIMKKTDVSEPFLDYKKEVDICYSDVVSILENMVETGDFDTARLSNMYRGLIYFSERRTNDLPALFDELGVEYTVNIDENGKKTINYSYTFTSPYL